MILKAGDQTHFSIDGEPYQRGDYRFIFKLDKPNLVSLFDKGERVTKFGFKPISEWQGQIDSNPPFQFADKADMQSFYKDFFF